MCAAWTEHFALEAERRCAPLPAEAFDVSVVVGHRVDRKSRVSVRGCLYSVPVAHVAERLDVRVEAERIEVFDGARVVARHARAVKGDEVLVLDHYLEALAVKTGAFPGARPWPKLEPVGPSVQPTSRSGPRPAAASVTATTPAPYARSTWPPATVR